MNENVVNLVTVKTINLVSCNVEFKKRRKFIDLNPIKYAGAATEYYETYLELENKAPALESIMMPEDRFSYICSIYNKDVVKSPLFLFRDHEANTIVMMPNINLSKIINPVSFTGEIIAEVEGEMTVKDPVDATLVGMHSVLDGVPDMAEINLGQYKIDIGAMYVAVLGPSEDLLGPDCKITFSSIYSDSPNSYASNVTKGKSENLLLVLRR